MGSSPGMTETGVSLPKCRTGTSYVSAYGIMSGHLGSREMAMGEISAAALQGRDGSGESRGPRRYARGSPADIFGRHFDMHCPGGSQPFPFHGKRGRNRHQRSRLRHLRVAKRRTRHLDKGLARQIELAGRRIAVPAVAAGSCRRLCRRIDRGGNYPALTFQRCGCRPADGAQQAKDDHESDNSHTLSCPGAEFGCSRHRSLKRSKQAGTLHAVPL